MDAVQKLTERDRAKRLKIAVIGDAMVDEYYHGRLEPSQDGCQKFIASRSAVCPGGAANAAHQLAHWNADAFLIASWHRGSHPAAFDASLCHHTRDYIRKTRYIDDATGRIVFRRDHESANYGLATAELTEIRDLTVKAVRTMGFDAVLISDYDKGFLDRDTIKRIIAECTVQRMPVVADAKQKPITYDGALLKCNGEYDCHKETLGIRRVVTHGGLVPTIHWPDDSVWTVEPVVTGPVHCRNHVGAGDCFAAHLVLGLAHGLGLGEAAQVAHAAGRCYVQHQHNRPPYPFEVRKDMTGSKRIDFTDLRHLRESLPGKRIVFTNGVFRLGAHAGHAWLMRWAKQQGDVLVVGVNSDESARSLRPADFVLSEGERVQILESMEAVDWVVTFSAQEPIEAIRMLQPDVLTKGPEYAGQRVPGDDLVKDVRFSPESPFPAHCSDLELSIVDTIVDNENK
jgi:D-beta-D-heptose 7-phosphate kinase/D-beta-D-heptose 1-phosphate adenosyltransferase